jgi:hypothetical protein
MNKNNGMLEHMELERIKKRMQHKIKNKLCNKICSFVRISVVPTGQGTKLLHVTPDAAPTMIAMNDVNKLMVIVIAPPTTNVEWQSALISSAPDIVTGRMTAATISLKS